MSAILDQVYTQTYAVNTSYNSKNTTVQYPKYNTLLISSTAELYNCHAIPNAFLSFSINYKRKCDLINTELSTNYS